MWEEEEGRQEESCGCKGRVVTIIFKGLRLEEKRFIGQVFGCKQAKCLGVDKPAAQAAGADAYQCNSTTW